VSYSFKQSGRRKFGYDMSQVDEFLQRSREQYSNPNSNLVTVLDVRTARFKLVKNGYSISVVDAALEKLEDAFAASEFQREVRKTGFFEFSEDLQVIQDMVLARTTRAKGKKFTKRRWPNKGYSVKEVDKFCSLLGNMLATKADLTVQEVRVATFKSKRGGYAEYQVDAFIEKVVEVLQRQAALKEISR
jgi:DivIVA domain-containing protein